MRNLLLTAAGLLAATVPCAPAQPSPQPLTLADCIRLAQSAPSPVSLARQERDIAARETTKARAGFLPQSRLVNGFTYNSPLHYNREMFSHLPLNGIREYAFLFSVDQEFDTSGRLRADLARARVAGDLAGTSLALTERDLKRAVTTSYYRALLTRRIARIVQGRPGREPEFRETHETALRGR